MDAPGRTMDDTHSIVDEGTDRKSTSDSAAFEPRQIRVQEIRAHPSPVDLELSDLYSGGFDAPVPGRFRLDRTLAHTP